MLPLWRTDGREGGHVGSRPLECHSCCCTSFSINTIFPLWTWGEWGGLFWLEVVLFFLFVFLQFDYSLIHAIRISFFWCCVFFSCYTSFMHWLIPVNFIYHLGGKKSMGADWSQTAKPALTTALSTKGSFLYWQIPIITLQLSATRIKSQVVLRWRGGETFRGHQSVYLADQSHSDYSYPSFCGVSFIP